MTYLIEIEHDASLYHTTVSHVTLWTKLCAQGSFL